ncbi:MAG: PQQ-binding-like beta-propeller repeat protein [Gemmataceae bacterium]
MTRRSLALFAVPLLLAADWPTFLGPTQDGVSTETGIIRPWPKDGLKKLWECPLGVGYAPPVVAAGKLYHFDRHADACRLTCREAATGKQLWSYEYPTTYEDFYGYDPGPRACPVVDGDRVYVLGPEGTLACVSAADGKERWKLDTRARYRFHQNFFGVGSVPVVEGNTLIVAVGGSPKGPRPVDLREAKPDGSAVVGLDKLTGAERYRTGDELASYSSPVVRTIDGKRTGLYFARGGLFAFDPQTGAQRFAFRWRAKSEESVNAANPLVVGDRILLSECYGPGAALLEAKNAGVKAVWTDDDKDRFEKSLLSHWCTPIHIGGFVYGSSGRHDNDADVRCVELATGDVKWTLRRASRCTFTAVDGHLIGLGEFGELFLFRPNPARYEEVSRYRMPELSYPCWAPPVVSDGRMFVRGKERLVCLELAGKK